MSIKNNVTFRRKHRPVWYGMLCLVLITAAVSTMSLIPAQSNDLSSAEGVGDYTLSVDGDDYGTYTDLEDLIAEINENDGTDFTITVNGNDSIASGFTLNAGKEVTLTSSSAGPFTLTVTEEDVRHFTVVSGTLILENIILDGKETGGGVEIGSSGVLIMKAGAVIQNCFADNGGGVYNGGGTFTMNGGIIEGNEATSDEWYVHALGGGVYNAGIFTMSGGKIIGNKAYGYKSSGAGVFNEGEFTMNGGEISGNNTEEDRSGNGGGLYNIGIFTMSNGAVIQNCNASDGNGGGLYNIGIFTMSNGAVIQNCKAREGGGVYNDGGTFTMNGGFIKDNRAFNKYSWSGSGGGVYNDGGTFDMYGGEISGNTISSGYGAGVGNYKKEISYSDSGPEYIVGEFTFYGGEIKNNIIEGSGNGGGVSNGGTFTMEGGKISDNKVGLEWRSGSGSGVSNSGNFTMKNGEISSNISGGDGGGVINGGTFTMEGGKISSNTADIGGGVNNGGHFEMKKGEISVNKALGGGGVYNNYDGTITMYGGKISNNGASEKGGGVFNYYDGTITMYGGEISVNTAVEGGGVYNDRKGTFNIDGGKISDNTAKTGGGVYNYFDFDGSRLLMKDGVISGNKASENGGGVYNYDNSVFTMEGGKISGNIAVLGGGIYNAGIYLGGIYRVPGTVTMTGGEISDNTATGTDKAGSGGGIFTESLEWLTIKPAEGKEVVFSGNKAPTLRIKDIGDDAEIYAERISDIKLDELFNLGQNAPAYNNYDISYPGDTRVVFISIAPNNGGTVNVTDSADRTKSFSLKDGCVLVPVTVNWITLSAIPKNGYVFKQFTMDELEIHKPIGVKVVGNMEIIAKFVSTSAQPEHGGGNIDAVADNGSTITPSGTVKVPYGENKTFTFSAKPGYKITAVKVDKVPISSAELASGEYTFRDVKSDHTIEVISETDDESGGGSDIGAGGSGGNETGSGGNANGEWFVIGMICAMLAVFSGVIALIVRMERQQKRGA